MIVIEGLDGSGKATQSNLLYEALEKAGKAVRKASFPAYASDSSALIKLYLAGSFGKDPSDVNAYAASTFFAVDRFASFKSDWGKFYEDGGIIVADQYTTSNAIHQCSKLSREEWDGYIDWLFDFEFRLMGIPAPNKVIYLQVAPQVSQKLMTGRYNVDKSKKDIHESNLEYLAKSRLAAQYCAHKLGWEAIVCDDGEAMRSIDEIHRRIAELIKKYKEVIYKSKAFMVDHSACFDKRSRWTGQICQKGGNIWNGRRECFLSAQSVSYLQ